MIKIFFSLLLALPLFASSLSLYDLAFLVSKSSGKSVIFSKEVNQKIKIIVGSSSVDYLPLFKQALISNGYKLKSEKSFFYVSIPLDEIKKDGFLPSFSGSSASNGPLLPPPPLGSSGGISVTNNGETLYSSPPMASHVSFSDMNRSYNDKIDFIDENITFKSLSLVYLKADDLNDTLQFSGFKYSVSSNSKSVIFAVPQKKLDLYNNFIESIKALDFPHEQVTLKITVFDSNANKLRSLGMSPLFNLDSETSLNPNSVLGSLSSGSLFTGSLVHAFYSSLHALESKGVTSVKDTPTFLLSNNETLNFKSVLNVPFLDENVAVTSQTGTNQTAKYTYKAVGFKVLITPNIVNDTVYLDFSISFESLVNNDIRPTTSEKSIKNKFSLHKGDLLVLAGISKNIVKNIDSGVPFLKDLPYIGPIFSLDSKSSTDETFNISIEVVK